MARIIKENVENYIHTEKRRLGNNIYSFHLGMHTTFSAYISISLEVKLHENVQYFNDSLLTLILKYAYQTVESSYVVQNIIEK